MGVDRRAFACLAGAALMGGCSSVLPMARCGDMRLAEQIGAADEIRVHDNIGDPLASTPIAVLRDPARVEQVRQFIVSRPDRWHAPIESVPAGRVRIVFWQSERRRASVGLGPDMLIAQGCGDYFIRNISDADAQALAGLIEWDAPLTR